MRHVAAAALFACVLSVQANAVYGQAQEDSTATAFGFEVIVTEQAALLSRPFVLGETLGKLTKGDTLRILGAVEGYVHATHDGQEGYVRIDRLALSPEQQRAVGVRAERKDGKATELQTITLRLIDAGENPVAFVTYTAPGNTRKATEVVLPWQVQFQAEPGTRFTISAQLLDGGTYMEGLVLQNGTPVKRAAGDGAHARISLSYTVER